MSELRAELTTLKTSAKTADPVRLRYIESLLRKSEQVEGPLASQLEAKVRSAMADYREVVATAKITAGRPGRRDSGLLGLVRLLNESQAEDHDPKLPPLEQALRQQELDLVDEITEQANPPDNSLHLRQEELKAARRFQSAMVQLNADKVVTQAIAEIPESCGPLNPQRLATRSLETMRDLSPHYLSRFVSYIDTLFWLENADRGK